MDSKPLGHIKNRLELIAKIITELKRNKRRQDKKN
jgi:hypothetical protein